MQVARIWRINLSRRIKMGRERGRESGLEPRQSRSGTRVKGGKFKEMNGEGTGIANNFSAYHHRLFSCIDGRALRSASRVPFLNVGFIGEFSASSAWPLISGFRFETRDETRRGEESACRVWPSRWNSPATLHGQISLPRELG